MRASKWEGDRERQGRQPEGNGGKKKREKSNANFSFKFSTVLSPPDLFSGWVGEGS